MNRVSRIRISRICLVGAAALVLAAPTGAHVMRVNEADSSTLAQYGWGAAATVAKGQSNDLLAQYGWGAAATFAKLQQVAVAASTDNDLLAQYGWGAAAAYAKLHA